MADIKITKGELDAALVAVGRVGAGVYSAYKKGNKIILHLVGDKKPVACVLEAKKKKGA